MNFKEIISGREKVFYQLVSFFIVVLILIINIMTKLPRVFYYVLVLAALVNVILGIMNKKGSAFLNIILFFISIVSSVAFIGYFSILFGTIIAVPYFIVFMIRFFRR